jgi:deoxyadenosine/deoxycytidine kinase
MNVWVSGPTGAGKTSFSRIAQQAGFAVVHEQLPQARFDAFASDPARHCSELQREIMQSRFTTWKALASHPKIMFDRSVDEGIQVFCQMHFELGF